MVFTEAIVTKQRASNVRPQRVKQAIKPCIPQSRAALPPSQPWFEDSGDDQSIEDELIAFAGSDGSIRTRFGGVVGGTRRPRANADPHPGAGGHAAAVLKEPA